MAIRVAGYALVEHWSHKKPKPWWEIMDLVEKNVTYLHAIVCDFEA